MVADPDVFSWIARILNRSHNSASSVKLTLAFIWTPPGMRIYIYTFVVGVNHGFTGFTEKISLQDSFKRTIASRALAQVSIFFRWIVQSIKSRIEPMNSYIFKTTVGAVTCVGIALHILEGDADNLHPEQQRMPEIRKPAVTLVASGGQTDRLANGFVSSGDVYNVTFLASTL
jgi:hypothetical protein